MYLLSVDRMQVCSLVYMILLLKCSCFFPRDFFPFFFKKEKEKDDWGTTRVVYKIDGSLEEEFWLNTTLIVFVETSTLR